MNNTSQSGSLDGAREISFHTIDNTSQNDSLVGADFDFSTSLNTQNIIKEVVLLFLGVSVISLNFSIVTALSKAGLVKKYVLIVALAVCHSFVGVTQIIMASFYLRFREDIHERATGIECFSKIYPVMVVFFVHLNALHILAIAVERFCALVFPVWYYHQKWNARKACKTIGSIYLLSFLLTSPGVILVMVSGDLDTSQLDHRCVLIDLYGAVYSLYFKAFHSGLIVPSLVLEFAAILAGKRSLKKHLALGSNGTLTIRQRQQQVKRITAQLRFTAMVSTVTILNVVCLIIPAIAVATVLVGVKKSVVLMAVVIGSAIHAGFSLPIYAIFMPDIRSAVRNLVKCGVIVAPQTEETPGDEPAAGLPPEEPPLRLVDWHR